MIPETLVDLFMKKGTFGDSPTPVAFCCADMEKFFGKGMVGITSPIARALIGKTEGDEVVVQAPKGPVTYEIITVRYE